MNNSEQPAPSIRIALIEDDTEIREAYQSFFNKQTDIICILTADSVEAFLNKLRPFHAIDILLLDIMLPGKSGIDAIPLLKKKLPETDIIMFSVLEETDKLIQSLTLGAGGYIVKSDTIEEVARQVHIYQQGGAIISTAMARHLIRYFNPKEGTLSSKVNDKDRQVLRLLAEGWSYEHIAHVMEMSINGVRYYIKKIYKLLNVNNRQAAVRVFHQGIDNQYE